MSYVIVKNAKAWWPVTFAGVAEDGKILENRFEMKFLLLDEDEHQAFERDVRAMLDAGVGDQPVSALAAQLIPRMAEDWRGVEQLDDEGNKTSLPFTPENIALLMKVPNVFQAVAEAYRACRAGKAERRRGN